MLLDLLKAYWVPAPVLTMGIFATLAGMAAANFPETAGLRSEKNKPPLVERGGLKIGVGKEEISTPKKGQKKGKFPFTFLSIKISKTTNSLFYNYFLRLPDTINEAETLGKSKNQHEDVS